MAHGTHRMGVCVRCGATFGHHNKVAMMGADACGVYTTTRVTSGVGNRPGCMAPEWQCVWVPQPPY